MLFDAAPPARRRSWGSLLHTTRLPSPASQTSPAQKPRLRFEADEVDWPTPPSCDRTETLSQVALAAAGLNGCPGIYPLMANTQSFRFYSLLGYMETVIYMALGVLLAASALLALSGTIPLFATGVRDFTGTAVVFVLIDRLLLILLLVELLHTVRISVRSHVLVIEPFLIIGIIAIIRRTLVLTLQAESFTQNMHWTEDVKANFRASMVEGGMLALLLVVLVASIYVIRKLEQSKQVDVALKSASDSSASEEIAH